MFKLKLTESHLCKKKWFTYCFKCYEYWCKTRAFIYLKGACSEIFGKWIFSKLVDMVTFPANTSPFVKKLQICISFVSNLRKQCLCYLLFYKWWKQHFLISKRVFRWFLLNYTGFAHKIAHTKPSKYDSTFGTKISICLKKVGGMRLWIGTSTFNFISLVIFLKNDMPSHQLMLPGTEYYKEHGSDTCICIYIFLSKQWDQRAMCFSIENELEM